MIAVALAIRAAIIVEVVRAATPEHGFTFTIGYNKR
jgi:hypothetical protein